MTQTALEIPQVAVPHSREAEEAVVGSVLINPEVYYDVSRFLQAEDFYIHRHRWIWEAFTSLHERYIPIDLLSLTEELDRKDQLAEVGGPAYLTALVNQVPSSLNAESYGRIVEGHSIRRRMIFVANTIASLAYNEKITISECTKEAVSMIANLESLSELRNLSSLGELFSQVYDATLERAKEPSDVWGLATGLPKLDKKTGGLQMGELWYLAGKPAVGKTWLELSWGMELGSQAPGAIISLEMRKLAIGRRLLSGVSGVPTRAMKSGYVKENEWERLSAAIENYSSLPIWIDDNSYSSDRLRSVLTWAKREHGIRWFIVDYALLLTDAGRDETEQSKIISANMKRIVHDLDLGGIVLHSVTKVGMNGHNEPEQGDQRGSGQAIHDCDVQLQLTEVPDNDLTISKSAKSKSAILWCTKGRELEESKFKIYLTRQHDSPFWGEMETRQSDERERKDLA